MNRPIRALALALSCLPLLAAAQPVAGHGQRQAHPLLMEYAEFLALPNVASDTANIRRNAAHLARMMEKRGLAPRLLETEGAPPVVFGEWRVPGATRTLMFYAHYDGQPADPAQWRTGHPWQPHLRDGRHDQGGEVIPFPARDAPVNPDWRIYGRAASDDKAGVMALLAAVDALRAAGLAPTVNLKFFFEGEEEAGSPHLATLLATHRALLAADAWLICDGPVHPSGRKQVVFGVRGDTNVDLTVYGPLRPLHSGHYGNWAPNPGQLLVRLLATMKDDAGRVTIKGWYDDVEPLGAAERAAIAEAPAQDESLKRELGVPAPEAGRTVLEAIALPSLNLNGIRSGDVLEAARNAIPTTASATLDLRLVKGVSRAQQVERLRAHVRAQGYLVLEREPTVEERRAHPRIVRLVEQPGGYDAERTAMDSPVARAVLVAVQSAARAPLVALPTAGGSLPLVVIREQLGAPSISVPIVNHDNNQHAEDENLRLGHLFEGIDIMAALMRLAPW